ncbi:MAG: tRNA nucleotidyltransferase (CCA-adding enzyme) [Myxococcota bacterium]
MSDIARDIVKSLETTADGLRLIEIAEVLAQAGGRAVLVGGAVRDGLLGLPVKDLDVEVYGIELNDLKKCLRRFGKVLSVGQAFGVLMIGGLEIDFSLPRKDSKVGAGHRGFNVEFDPTLSFSQAAKRRDVTVNSMGVDLATIELLDPHGGQDDLRAKVLRATDPAAFGEDPLRALRVAQMCARFGFTVDRKLVELCATLDLSELPGERLFEEFRKLLIKGRKPSVGLAFLRESRLLRFFPELEAMIDVPQDPVWHPEGDVWVHTLMVVDCAAELRGELDAELASDVEAFMFAALCHDLGKPGTTQEVDGRIRSRGHDLSGVEPTESLLARLRASTELVRKTSALVADHLAPALLVEQGATPKAYRRLARKLGAAGVSMRLLERVARADHLGRTTEDALRGEFAAGDTFLREAEALSISSQGPPDIVLGRHLIELGHEPSPTFGQILDRCREVQDETGLSDPQVILQHVLEG